MATVTCSIVFVEVDPSLDWDKLSSAAVPSPDLFASRANANPHSLQSFLKPFGGTVVKHTAQGWMLRFQSATEALQAALCMLDVLLLLGEGQRLRAGCATGDVEFISGDLFGGAVNLASRIMDRTPVGQVWFSDGTRSCMRQTEVAWQSVGHFNLKGFAGSTEVLRAVPSHRTWLPDEIVTALRAKTLVRFTPQQTSVRIPPGATILLEGFIPGSDALTHAISRLPVVNPAQVWLVVHRISSLDRHDWRQSGRGLVVATKHALDNTFAELMIQQNDESNTDTLILDSITQMAVELVVSGLALPSVPLSNVVAGYSYDLMLDGRWVNLSEQGVAQVDVSAKGVTFRPRMDGLRRDGERLISGNAIALHDGDVIDVLTSRLTYKALTNAPYVGLLYMESPVRMAMGPGQRVELGREPRLPGLALSDRKGQDNIRWCSGMRASRARISGYTMDRALAGRRQAVIRMIGDTVAISTLHERCLTYKVVGSALEAIDGETILERGEHIVTGTDIVAIEESTTIV